MRSTFHHFLGDLVTNGVRFGGALLVLAAAFLLAAFTSQPTIVKWEYKAYDADGSHGAVAAGNILGAFGWEMISCYSQPAPSGAKAVCFFKRRLP